MLSGKVINLMKYSIHDGPGIRTTVFFKGCPLNCLWCHNPESQQPGQELMIWAERCIGCGRCLEVCAWGALVIAAGKLDYRREQCQACGECCKVCPAGAREPAAKTMSVREVMAELEKDLVFYDESGGGATFSGGEALLQPVFLLELLKECRKKEIHTTLETCGFTNLEVLRSLSDFVDLFLYDLKLMDSRKHQEFTGVPNELILANLRWLAEHHPRVIVRVPVIPGVNDDPATFQAMGEFVASLKRIRELHLLPYHKAGADKYLRLGRVYQLPDIQPPEPERLEQIKGQLEAFGLAVKIGG